MDKDNYTIYINCVTAEGIPLRLEWELSYIADVGWSVWPHQILFEDESGKWIKLEPPVGQAEDDGS